MFKAIHNVSIGLRMYKRGETIPDVPEKMQKWLLEQGAIERINAPFLMPEEDTPPVDPNHSEDDADGEDEDAQEDGEMPEIDVMDGIVTGEAPAPKGRSKAK